MSDTFPTITINGHTLPSAAIAFEFNRLARFYSEHMPEDQVRQQLPALREKGTWMRLECEDGRHNVALCRFLYDLTQYGLVATMDPIEVTDGNGTGVFTVVPR